MPPSEDTLNDDLIHYRRLLDALHDGVYFVDTERRILYWNDAAERISGYAAAEVIGRRCMDNILVHVDEGGTQLCLGMCPLAATILDGEHRVASVYLHHKDGSRRPVSVRTARVTDAAGTILGGVEIFSDNSAAMAVIERIKHLESMVYLDSLTGLPNRRYVEIALRDRLGERQRYGWPFGVLLADLDGFKQVNDRHGHSIGDLVLQMVAQTIGRNMRSFDIVGRWGGDEFMAVLPSVDTESLRIIAERCRALVEHSCFPLRETTVGVTLSVGGTVAREEDTRDSLVERTDHILFRSKTSGKNHVIVG